MEKQRLIRPIDYIAGCFTGVVKILVGQPFDILKVRMQSNHLIKNPFSLLYNIIQNEGLFALYKGTLSPLIGLGAITAIQFGVNASIKNYIKKKNPEMKKFSVKQLSLAGSLAGICATTVVIPVEHVRIRMQVQKGRMGAASVANGKTATNGPTSEVKYTGSVDCAAKIVKEHGVSGFYRGATPTILREAIGFLFYFMVFEVLMQKDEERYGSRRQIPITHTLLYGGFAGMCYWMAIYPIDCIKSRMQSDNLSNPTFKGTRQTFLYLSRNYGVASLFKGLGPCLVRAPLVNSAAFAFNELFIKYINRH